MASTIKVDTIENVAGSGNVSLGSGHNLVVPGNQTVGGTLGVTGTTTTAAITSTGRHEVNFNGSSTQAFKYTDTGGGNLASFGQFYNPSNALIGNIQNASNTGIHLNVGTNGSIVFDQTGYTAANSLGNYEEGTWTPAFSSQMGTIAMNSVGGRYQRIGNFVTAMFWLNWSSITGNGSYGVQLTGLPFTSVAQIVSERDVGIILGAGFEQVPILNNSYNTLGGYMNQNATTATFRMSGGGQSERSLDGSISKAGGYLYGMVRYKAV